MKAFKYIFATVLFVMGSQSFSQGIKTQSDHVANASCDLQIYSMGAVETTPLQNEAEWILNLKGYNLVRRSSDDFYKADLTSTKMFATYRAGTASMNSQADCTSQQFEDLGKFYTCRYELTLYFYSEPKSDFIPAVQIKAATRDARSTDAFYQNVYNQLRELPYCL